MTKATELVLITCSECGSQHEIQRQTEMAVKARHNGNYLCGSCSRKGYTPSEKTREAVRAAHLGVPRPKHVTEAVAWHNRNRFMKKAAEEGMPTSLLGDKFEKRTHKCESCGSFWEQDCGAARQWYRKMENHLLCRRCKQLSGTRQKVEVTCSSCGKTYMVVPEAIKKAEREGYAHRCGSCSQAGRCVSEEERKKISEKLSGRKLSAEHIENIRKASNIPERYEALSNWNTNRTVHPIKKGHQWREETIAKRAAANTGKKRSEAVRQQMSESRKAMLQRTGGYSQETRQKISQTITRLRMDGFKPESAHKQEVYTPEKACVPGYEKQVPYTLSSSWESLFARWLDLDPTVATWSYEAVSIIMDSGSRPYLTDFIYRTTDGRTHLVEVKPSRKMTLNVDRAADKWEALQIYCQAKEWIPEIVTEIELQEIADLFGEVLCI